MSCDVILISDTHIYSNEQPTVTTGLRGLSYMEVEVEGPNRDLHSGLYGGAVPNPINVLAEMIAKLHDEDGKITIDEMTGGTFTITNGGVFGSMLSTPIINPPQSAILGMHNIIERPVAVNGKVEIRPMMYLAVSYDHRIIDGRESVGFLVAVNFSCIKIYY